MADNFKMSINATYSEQTDYTDPEWVIDDSLWDPFETDPTEKWGPSKVLATTGGGTNLDLTYLATSAVMLLKNLDRSNYVQVSWTDVSGTACIARVPAGGLLVVPAINPGTQPVIAANGAAVLCKFAFVQNS